MSLATSSQTFWRRIRFTPLSDALRGRLTGRLDFRLLIARANLSEAAARRVHDVARGTRLWRSEKIDAATELIGHFRDGLEAGTPANELLADFGAPRRAARLIRRAKKRNRPWPWHIARAASLTLCAALGFYVLAGLLLLLGRPAVTVDYVARINAQALAMPKEDQAWPIYRQVLLAGMREMDLAPILVPKTSQGRSGRVLRAGEPGWPEATAFLQEHADMLARIRAAATKPGLGLVTGHGWDFTGLDREALYGPDHPPGIPSPTDPTLSKAQQLAERSLVYVLLPQLGTFRKMGRLLTADTELAWEQGDHDRVFANLATLLGLARHTRENPTFISSLVAISIFHLAQHQVADLLHRDPTRWSRAELTRLAHLLATVDPLVQPMFEGERMMMHDTFQRLYSGHGYVTHDGLQFLNQMHPLIDDLPNLVNWTSIVGLPAANALMASRSEMERKYDKLMALVESEASLTPWERMRQSLADDAIHALAADWWGHHSLPPESRVRDDAIHALAADWWGRIRYWPLVRIMPSMTSAYRTTDRSLAFRDVLQVVIAMELYRRDHQGRYPADLADLGPRYLPVPAVDYSTGGPLRVRYTEDGHFLLYGLGHNGQDDGGTLSAEGKSLWPGIPPSGDWVLYPPMIQGAARSGEIGEEQ